VKNTTILLIRHGEKPGNPAAELADDGPGLSADGRARAQKYVEYFGSFQAHDIHGTHAKAAKPAWVFATADNPGTSYRPRLTVTPFADAALVPLRCCIDDKDYAELVKQLHGDTSYDDTTILICWHHGKILELADHLLTHHVKGPLHHPEPGACWPKRWPPEVFGWLLQIHFDHDGNPDRHWVRCINERLMTDDDNHDPCSTGP